MKKIRFLFYLLICSISTISCGQFLEPTEYHFDNFKNTPVEKIAMAARANNSKLILELARKNESEIDFKDPKFNMTLLAVAIANKKDKAINALLSINANPNILVGNDSEYTPFSMAINYNEDCTTLLIEKMLHHNANPNLEINTPNGWLDKKIPLFEAIQKRKANGEECIELVQLLTRFGASTDSKIYNKITGDYLNIVGACLITNRIKTLRYLIVDKKISVPYPALTTGVKGEEVKKYSLSEILNTEEYAFKNNPELKKAKEDIIEYLKKNPQK